MGHDVLIACTGLDLTNPCDIVAVLSQSSDEWVWAVLVGEASRGPGEHPLAAQRVSWTLARSGIYFATGGRRWALQHLDLEAGSVRELVSREGPHMWVGASPDGKWILYSGAPSPTAEVMLVENFR